MSKNHIFNKKYVGFKFDPMCKKSSQYIQNELEEDDCFALIRQTTQSEDFLDEDNMYYIIKKIYRTSDNLENKKDYWKFSERIFVENPKSVFINKK